MYEKMVISWKLVDDCWKCKKDNEAKVLYLDTDNSDHIIINNFFYIEMIFLLYCDFW